MAYAMLNRLIKVSILVIVLYAVGKTLFVGKPRTDYLESMKQMLGHEGELPEVQAKLNDLADGLKDSYTQNMDQALRDLFKELDADGDGCIRYEEFSGMTLTTWAAFRAIDYAFKSRLALPTFASLRASVADTVSAAIPAELQFLTASNWWDTFQKGLIWYVLFLFYIQCALCAWENVLGFLGLKSFDFPKNPDVSKVLKVGKPQALQYPTPLSGWYEVTKTVVVSVSGLPILRMLQGVVFVLVGMMAINIAVMVPNKYWKGFWLRGVTSLCISGTLFSFGYYRVGLEGKVAPRSECKLLIGNHMAILEILVMFGLSFPSFISATENTAVPLFSGVVRACNAILVDRKDKNSRRHTMHEIKRRSTDPEAPQLMIFPEATLNNQEALFTFKPGAFETGQPVQPILFKFPYKHFNPTWTGEATGGNEIGEVTWRTLCQIVNRIEVKVLPVYKPSPAERKDKYLFSENVRALMAAHLEIGLSECVYEDYVELQRAYARIKRVDVHKAWWLPFSRRRHVSVVDLMNQASDDDSHSLTSCDSPSTEHIRSPDAPPYNLDANVAVPPHLTSVTRRKPAEETE